MQIDIREIINIPGSFEPFDCEVDMSEYSFDSVKEFLRPVRVSGSVKNISEMFVLTAEAEAEFICVCARCLREFEKTLHIDVEARIAAGAQDDDDPDVYLLNGDFIDVDEIIATNIILNMEQRFLCREDCKGLCDKCGADLNDGPCSCKKEIDPRLTVLGQLLEN